MNNTQNKWDQRWREKAATTDRQVDPWLRRIFPIVAKDVAGGRALDLACGAGRNAIFLAEQGLEVTAADISSVALSQLRKEAQRRKLAIKTLQLDLEVHEPHLPDGLFDLLIDFFFLSRPLLAQLSQIIRPGGFVVVRTFSSAGSDLYGMIDPRFALQPGELLEIFAGWKVLLHEEGLEPSKKGGSLAGIVARRW